MDSLKVSLLKCTTASETLVMHRTTFLCLSLVQGSNDMRLNKPLVHFNPELTITTQNIAQHNTHGLYGTEFRKRGR